MQSIREFLSSDAGKLLGIMVFVVCVAMALYSAGGFFAASEAATSSADRVYINAKTGEKQFISITPGFKTPEDSFEAEKCFWTADGQVLDRPEYVLTEEAQGKPGPTFCPACGRLVVPLNPPASTNGPPPPTKAEWEQRRQDQSGSSRPPEPPVDP